MSKKMSLQLSRGNDGRLLLKITVPEEVEQFFNRVADGETQTSKKWLKGEREGAEFYQRSKENEDTKKLSLFMQRQRVFNDYGDGLLRDDGSINLAPLRTVGASHDGGVTIYSENFHGVSNMDFEQYVRRLADVTKSLWESFISSRTLAATVTFEV